LFDGKLIMVKCIISVFGMAGYSGNANLFASSIHYVINVVMIIPALIYVTDGDDDAPCLSALHSWVPGCSPTQVFLEAKASLSPAALTPSLRNR
jgi:hypothetical protein